MATLVIYFFNLTITMRQENLTPDTMLFLSLQNKKSLENQLCLSSICAYMCLHGLSNVAELWNPKKDADTQRSIRIQQTIF